ELTKIDPAWGVIQVHADEIHVLAQQLRHTQHLGQVPWLADSARNGRITHPDRQFVPTAIEERALVVHETPGIDLNQLHEPAEDVEPAIAGRFAGAVVDEFLDEDSRDYILVGPLAAQAVVVRGKPRAALPHQCLAIEPALVTDDTHPTRAMSRLHHEAAGQLDERNICRLARHHARL